MNVGTVEAKFAVDATDLEKLPAQARAAMQRAEQEFAKAAKGITAAFAGVGSGLVDQFGKPVEAATRKAALGLDELDKIAKRFTGTLKGLSSDPLNNVSAGARNAAAGFNLMQSSWVRFAVLFAGGNLIASSIQQIAVQMRELVQESSRLGREQQLQEATFMSFASSVGVAGDVLAAKIEAVAGGIIDSGDAMKIALRGLSEGLQPEQIVTLTDAARQLAKSLQVDAVEAYRDLIEAIATGQSRRLKDLGITIDSEAALKKYAMAHGVTAEQLTTSGKAQALYAEVVEKSSRLVESNRKINDEFGESMQRLKVAWQDVQETVGVFINDTAVKVLTWLKQVKADVGEAGTIWVTTWTNAVATLTPLSAEGGSLWKLQNLVGNVAYALAALAEIMNLQLLIFAKWTGALQYASLVLQDLAAGRLPEFSAHTAAVTKRVEDATKAYEESGRVLDRLRSGMAGATGAADEFGQGWGRAAGTLNAGRNALGAVSNQVKALVPDLKALAAEAEKIADAILRSHVAAAEAQLVETERELALELELTNKLLAEETRLVDLGTAGWLAYIDAKFAQTEAGLAAELDITNQKLAEEKTALDAVAAGWVAHAEAIIAGTEQELQAVVSLNAPLRAYQDTMQSIGVEAQLFGTRFDQAGATISAMEGRLKQLAATSNGVVTPAMQALAVELEGLRQFQDLKDLFQGVFASIGSTLNTLVEGVLLGTQTMAQAWDKLWKSIVIGLINSGIQRLIKGLGDSLWDVVAGFFGASGGGAAAASGGGGGDLIGAVVGGAGKLIGAIFGGAGSTLGAVGGSLSDTLRDVGVSAATAGSSIGTFKLGLDNALPVLTSIIGLGTSVYGLVSAFQSGNGLGIGVGLAGTALSAYGLASSLNLVTPLTTLIMAGIKAVAPSIATAISNAVGAGVSSAANAVPTLASGVIGAVNPGTVFGAMFALGGIAGQQHAAELYQQFLREIGGRLRSASSAIGTVTGLFDDVGDALTTARLPETLSQLQYAIRSLPELFHAVGVGAEELNAIMPEWRAKVGAVLLATLDAASRAGVDASSITASPVRFSTDPNRFDRAGNAVGGTPNLAQLVAVMDKTNVLAGQRFENTTGLVAHLLELTGEQGHQLATILAAQINDDTPNTFSANNIDALWAQLMTPEHLAQILSHGGIGDIGNFGIDPAAINRLLDGEFLTIALRNAVVDIGAMLGLGRGFGGLTPGGSTDTDWTMPPGDSTVGSGTFMPSVAAIAEVQARLKAAGFEPGNYGQALADYLIAIDANVVNHPAWAQFAEALKGGLATVEDIAAIAGGAAGATGAAMAAVSSADFYAGAKALVDNLREQIDHQLELRAGTTDTDTLKNIDAVLETMTGQVKAWAATVQLYSALPAEMAALTGTIQEQMAAAIDAWHLSATTLADNITDARKQFDKALDTGNIVAIQATAQALHDAVIAQHQALVQMVNGILANLAKLQEAQATVQGTLTGLAVADLAAGDATAFNEIFLALANIAQTAPLATDRLFAIGAGIAAVLAALPTTAGFFANGASLYGARTPPGAETSPGVFGGQQSIPDQIVDQLKANVAPFFAALADMIQAAAEAGDLAGQLSLLQQQAELLKQVGAAAVAAVQAWANAAIEATNTAADALIVDINKNWDAWDKAINAAADAEIKAIEATRDAALALNEVRMTGLQAEATAIQAALQLAQQWVSALDAAKGFQTSLLLGEGSPLNKAQQLDLVKAQYEAARAAALSSPEAFGRFQSSAQQRLQFEGNTPTLVAQVLKDLQAAMRGAPANNVSILQQQLKGITDEIAELQTLNTTIRDAAAKDIEHWNEWRATELEKAAILRAADIDLVNKWRDAQVLAIEATAEATIKGIQTGVAAALRANALEQNTIIDKLTGAQLEQLNAITGGLSVQTYMADRARETVRLLALIQGDISGLLTSVGGSSTGGTPTPPPPPVPEDASPAPIPSFAMGTPFVPRTGLYRLHGGERVTPASQNRGGGSQVLVIEELHVHSHLDGQEVSEVVFKNIPVKVRSGKRGFIPKDAIGR